MNRVARRAGDIGFIPNKHVTRIGEDVPFDHVHLSEILFAEINFKITEQVIFRNEVVGVGSTIRLRDASTQVTLAACGDFRSRCIFSPRRKEGYLRFSRVLGFDNAMTDKAVESGRAEPGCFRINGCRVTSGTFIVEEIIVPMLLSRRVEFASIYLGMKRPRKSGCLAIRGKFFQIPNIITSAQENGHFIRQ